MTCQSKHMLVCIMWTPCFCFARLSCCGSPCFDHIKIKFFGHRQRLVSLSFKNATVHISLLEHFFFLEIDVCVLPLFVDFVRYPGGLGHDSRDSIRPIKCRFSRSNGGDIFLCELRIGCRFSTDFCVHHENQTKMF